MWKKIDDTQSTWTNIDNIPIFCVNYTQISQLVACQNGECQGIKGCRGFFFFLKWKFLGIKDVIHVNYIYITI